MLSGESMNPYSDLKTGRVHLLSPGLYIGDFFFRVTVSVNFFGVEKNIALWWREPFLQSKFCMEDNGSTFQEADNTLSFIPNSLSIALKKVEHFKLQKSLDKKYTVIKYGDNEIYDLLVDETINDCFFDETKKIVVDDLYSDYFLLYFAVDYFGHMYTYKKWAKVTFKSKDSLTQETNPAKE
jgi:hypothetical protein